MVENAACMQYNATFLPFINYVYVGPNAYVVGVHSKGSF